MSSYSYSIRVTLIFLSITISHPVLADGMVISWTGAVTSVYEYSAGSVPAQITVGDPVTGTLSFERSAYDRILYWQGTAQYGQIYPYQQGLYQSIRIRDLNWVAESGKISLIENTQSPFSPPRKSFEVLSTLDDGNDHTLFPDFFGNVGALAIKAPMALTRF